MQNVRGVAPWAAMHAPRGKSHGIWSNGDVRRVTSMTLPNDNVRRSDFGRETRSPYGGDVTRRRRNACARARSRESCPDTALQRNSVLLPESDEEDVVHARAAEYAAAEVDPEPIRPGHHRPPAAIHRDRIPRVEVRTAEALRHERDAVRGVPRDEDVGPAGGDERSGAEVDRRLEGPGHHHLAGRVHRDAPAGVLVEAAGEFRPHIRAGGRVLRDEHVLVREARRPARAEVDRVLERPGHQDVAAAVARDAVAGMYGERAPEVPGPEVAAGGRELGEEDV